MSVIALHAGNVVQERDVQRWVDAAYAPIADAWRRELSMAIERATDSVLRTNVPLASHEELERAFRELFDGTEVVPTSLREEYVRTEREQPLLVGGLRIPISNGQQHRLRRAGCLDGDFADVPYDFIRGLALDATDDA